MLRILVKIDSFSGNAQSKKLGLKNPTTQFHVILVPIPIDLKIDGCIISSEIIAVSVEIEWLSALGPAKIMLRGSRAAYKCSQASIKSCQKAIKYKKAQKDVSSYSFLSRCSLRRGT